MKKYIKDRLKLLLLLIMAFCTSPFAYGQVTVDAKVDSIAIFIGQQAHLDLEVSASKGQKIEFPLYDSLRQIVPGIEVLGSSDADTTYLNEGKRILVHKSYTITSFDTALYRISPMKVKVDGRTYESKSSILKVLTFDVDTLHPENIYGMKDTMSPPFDWNEWRPVVWCSLLIVVFTLILLYVIARMNDNKPIIRRIKNKLRLPAHKAAMQKIEKIKDDKVWQSEDSKEYYTRLTDTLREYIRERYGFNAMEMTSAEIIERLQAENDPSALNELNELFSTADLVKFAKYTTLINENDRNLVTAIEYINKTKKEETEQEQPKEIVVVEPRSLQTKRILTYSLIVLGILLMCVVAYLIYKIILLNI